MATLAIARLTNALSSFHSGVRLPLELAGEEHHDIVLKK
jgi:hypothetical protein